MSNVQRAVLLGLIVALVLIVPLGRAMMFTVNERELAVVLQFGRPVRSCTEPKLYFKIPFVQEVRRLPKTYQFWSGAGDILTDLLTADGKKIEVTPWAVWQITDPVAFVQELRTVGKATDRVKPVVRRAVRDVIANNDLAELVRSTNRELTRSFQVEPPSLIEKSAATAPQQTPPEGEEKGPALAVLAPSPEEIGEITLGREKIVQKINTRAKKGLTEIEVGEGKTEQVNLGIKLVDVGIARIDFVDEVREATFKRLSAKMESIASLYENEGERLKTEILNKTAAEVEEILGQGSQEANIIRGKVDAEIIEAYAEAIEETGEFYTFIRTLEAYQEALGPNTRLILTTDSELLELLKENPPPPAEASKEESEADAEASKEESEADAGRP